MNKATLASVDIGDEKREFRHAQIQEFLNKAFWLCGNVPSISKRSYFGQWLICCLQKAGDAADERAKKREAVQRILQYLELPQREGFENKLIRFVHAFSQHAPMRFRECSSRIESGTDWGRTYQKALVESAGRLCSFVNYSRKHELDHATKDSLVLLALDMAKGLREFASLIDGISDGAFENMTKGFRDRARRLEALRNDCERLPQQYNHERMDYALRRTLEGRRLADDIARWIFTPEWDFKIDHKEHANAGHLLEKVKPNEDKLFEIIATVTSIQVLRNMGFHVVKCDISRDKPVVLLENGDVFCQVRKNFDVADKGQVEDKLIHYRTVGNSPRGLQPDIVYKFWKDGSEPVYRLGDAKNYGKEDNSNLNYPAALFAMMHYLIAYRDELGIATEDVIPMLTGKKKGEKAVEQKKIVLFFSKPCLENGEEKYYQPGEEGKTHPLLFVYGRDAQTKLDDGDNEALRVFFQEAIKELETKGHHEP